MTPLIALLPWAVLLLVVLPMGFWRRPRLVDGSADSPPDAPLVSVIVPARDEAENISGCLGSLLQSGWPDYEIIVLDDRSRDGTREIAEALAEQTGGRVRVVAGKPLPDGWIGKPWACWQGYQAARGDLLLFTDADTRHGPELLTRAVRALRDRDADMLSVLPRQIMVGFWERFILPHVWFVITSRYPLMTRVNRTANPRTAMANGQFILVRRDAYDAIGGHAAVRHEVVEDVRLAQRMVAAGRSLFLTHGEEFISTRMYASLAGIIEGWSKNVARGASLGAWPPVRAIAPWVAAALPLVAWVLPPALLAASLAGVGGDALQLWASAATAASLFFWVVADLHHRIPVAYALTFPFGALATALVFVRSAIRGDRIRWKGRSYSDPPGHAADGGTAA
ncbi:MAG: glycosyltransferase [Gemmatimonadota bacterium]|jgi:chlorobactene glucosyltransferase